MKDRADSSERERRRVEVEPREDERPEENGPEEECADGERDPARGGAQRLERDHDQRRRSPRAPTVISTSNDRLVAIVRRRDQRRQHERDQGPRGVLDHEVSIRDVAGGDPLAVALVDQRVRDPGIADEPGHQQEAGRETDERPRASPRTRRARRHDAVPPRPGPPCRREQERDQHERQEPRNVEVRPVRERELEADQHRGAQTRRARAGPCAAGSPRRHRRGRARRPGGSAARRRDRECRARGTGPSPRARTASRGRVGSGTCARRTSAAVSTRLGSRSRIEKASRRRDGERRARSARPLAATARPDT